MWATTLIAMAALAASGGAAPSASERADSAHVRCVEAALRQMPARRTVTLVYRDGSWVEGRFLGLDDSRAVIRLQPDRDSAWFVPPDWRNEPLAVRTQDVVRLQWREAESIAVPLLGMLLGGVAGYTIGHALPGDDLLWGLCPRGWAIAGAAIGGALGLSVGVSQTSGTHQWHEIDCPPGALSAARSASGR